MIWKFILFLFSMLAVVVISVTDLVSPDAMSHISVWIGTISFVGSMIMLLKIMRDK